MRRIADYATLNANYLFKRLIAAGFEPAYGQRRASHEFILTLRRRRGRRASNAMDFAKRLLDYGFHAPTTYFPLLVPECLLIEPTETETPEVLDSFVAAMIAIREEAQTDPERVKGRAPQPAGAAPGRCPRRPRARSWPGKGRPPMANQQGPRAGSAWSTPGISPARGFRRLPTRGGLPAGGGPYRCSCPWVSGWGEPGERAQLLGSLLLVPIVELLNSAIETLVDRVGLEHHELSGRAKDIGSAAVFLVIVFAASVWALILIPRWLRCCR